MSPSDNLPDRVPTISSSPYSSQSRSLGELLEFYRDYLLTIANEKVSDEIHQKISPSDFVQNSFCEAIVTFESFDGRTSIEFKEWLKRILLNNIVDGYRALKGAQKRDVTREIPLHENSLEELESNTTAKAIDSPSARVRLNEQSQLLLRHLENLPDLEHDVVRMRSLDGLSFVEIGLQMDKSPDAVRKIWHRTIEKLAKEMKADESNFF